MAFATDTYVVKGMRQDDSDLLFNGSKEGLSFAFENLNMRFSTDRATTSLVATQEKGNTEITDIRLVSEFFLDTLPADYAEPGCMPFRVIGQCTVDKYLVVFGKCFADNRYDYNHNPMGYVEFNSGNDVIIRFERSGDTFYGWVLYNGNELDFRTDMPLETVGNVETNIVKKVYFVDGVHGPRTVNVVNEDAGELSNISLGYNLALNDVFTVSKDNSVQGNYPMGKVRFFYTYFNDEFSETNIVDWSPFFDCNYTNQGGSQASSYKTKFSFRIRVENVDSQFKFVRIYMQHFTTNDPTVYTMRYAERPISGLSNFNAILKFDQFDYEASDTTYLDKLSVNYSFIPYTLAEKNNRMFYGNIRKGLPDISGISFEGAARVIFDYKEIGYEELDKNDTYKYKSDYTTFAGSNYEYMGYRKFNWYRFGLIAQYQTGEWSDVFFIADARCPIASKTEVEYTHDSVGTTFDTTNPNVTPISVSNIEKIKDVPVRSRFFVPKAKLEPYPDGSFYDALLQLQALGFKRVKPVCVVPPKGYRDVITQGISCSTVYRGGDRKTLSTGHGRFAIPSWFYRPQPLYPVSLENATGYPSNVFRPSYPYTIRSVGDLSNSKNIRTSNRDWILNPRFDDDKFMTFNQAYREYRHGFSLPPKDRINAELQSSDFSVHDYYYRVNGDVSPIFGQSGLNLFDFSDKTKEPIFKVWDDIDIDLTTDDIGEWWNQLTQKYMVLPWHDLIATGYDNTVFVDESMRTLNSPEVDYDYDSQVGPWFMDSDIELVGYAQVTGSMMNVDIPAKQFRQQVSSGSDVLSSDNKYEVTGECLFTRARSATGLTSDTLSFIETLQCKRGMQNQPMLPTCGPWWLDTMLVNCFKHAYSDTLNGWTGHEDEHLLTGRSFGQDSIYDYTTVGSWSVNDDNLYNISSDQDSIYLDASKTSYWFCRGVDINFELPSYKLCTTFHGETNKDLHNNRKVCVSENAVYPYELLEKKMSVFNEFYYNDINFNLNFTNDDAEEFNDKLGEWALIPLSWNTILLTRNSRTDAYWEKWIKNRYTLNNLGDIDFDHNFSGIQTLRNNNMADQSIIMDPVKAVYYGDFRGLTSYYFYPFGKNVSSWYNKSNAGIVVQPWSSEYLRVVHPMLLPRDITAWDTSSPERNRDWIRSSNSVVSNILSGTFYYTDCNNMASGTPQPQQYLGDYVMEPSKFGAHYYAPCSTNFVGGYFEPYQAHVVYPFMTTDTSTPFCGSSDAYRAEPDQDVQRPSHNSSNSFLYSSCTNFIDIESPEIGNCTYSAYYASPVISQESRPEPVFTELPFISGSNINYLYSFNYSDAAGKPNVPLLQHNTYTLTAVMKWNRGFKTLNSEEEVSDANRLISNGIALDKSSIAGNLLFSGFMPQPLTKNFLLTLNVTDIYQNPLLNLGYMLFAIHDPDNLLHKQEAILTVESDLKRLVANDDPQTLSLDYLSTPHIVYCRQADSDTLELMPMLYANEEHDDITDDSSNEFLPSYYWKEFVGEYLPSFFDNAVPAFKKNVKLWYRSVYPHCGHFEEFAFDSMTKSDVPYWNYTANVFPNYPSVLSRPQYQVPMSETNPAKIDSKRFVTRDSEGQARKNENYWLLPVSNMYDSRLIGQYGNDKNPYTYEDISSEAWDWKMCGYTVNISLLLQYFNATVEYLEGDTYFQRYNSFKTISKDTQFSLLWENSESSDSVEEGINDVTETASVMIESYINLDGLYWDYNNLNSIESNPMLHPFWNNRSQINMAYSIQNGICDTFKQVDTNYYDAELNHYPTQILWSAQKHDGEDDDAWGIVPVTNKMLVSGEMGAISKLISYGDNVYCLQEHGLSVLNYNAQVIQPTTTDSTLTMYLSDSTRLQDVTYLSRNCGTLNKWSVAVGQRGFYWIDETLRQFCGYMGRDGGMSITNMSTMYGLEAWSDVNIDAVSPVWSTDTFYDAVHDNGTFVAAFKASYDLKTGDVYWADGESCICFNEPLDCFTSFYNYEKAAYRFNWLGEGYSVIEDADGDNVSTVWHDYSNYSHSLFGNDVDSYIELLVNPSGQYDKVFNFIEYNTEAYGLNDMTMAIPKFNPYTRVQVSNMYQWGEDGMNAINTKERFRVWRTSLPREFDRIHGKSTINRIRSPWCKIKLWHKADEGHPLVGSVVNDYADKLYYINVNYTIPEQPQRTNVRQ